MSLHVAVSGWLLGPPSGANTRLLALLREFGPLLREGERVTVLHRQGFTPPHMHAAIGWREVAIPAAPSWRRALAERRQLPRVLRDLDADLLDHAMLPLPRVPCPVVLTIHDLRDADGHGHRPRWFARWLVRRACVRARAVVVPSRFTAARLAAIAPSAPVTIVPNGVGLPPASPAPGSPAPRAGGHLLHVGHLEPRKNLGVLLRALARIPDGVRPELWLCGADAGAGRALHALARRLGVQDRVRFLGVVPDADLPSLYAGARAVVVPSRYEGFGLCALEGLAHGLPVLVSDAGALPEVVGAHGIVLPVDDIAAWAAAIERTADGGAIPSAGRARAATCSWQRAATQVVDLWREIAAAARRS